MKQIFILWTFGALLTVCSFQNKTMGQEKQRWSTEQSQKWSASNGWLRGSNFTPSIAVNQLETWQKETFDTGTINRELGWAEEIGMNCMRVFLHHLAWQIDREGFKSRMEKFLKIADGSEPELWFHDIFYPDGRPYRQEEIDYIKSLTGIKRSSHN